MFYGAQYTIEVRMMGTLAYDELAPLDEPKGRLLADMGGGRDGHW